VLTLLNFSILFALSLLVNASNRDKILDIVFRQLVLCRILRLNCKRYCDIYISLRLSLSIIDNDKIVCLTILSVVE